MFYGNDDEDAGFIDGEEFAGAIVGFETSPSNLPTSRTASYDTLLATEGGREKNGTVDAEFAYIADLTLTADFGASTIAGTATNGELIVTPLDENQGEFSESIGLTIMPGTIRGNSFETDIAVACSTGFTCTSGSEMGGAFYGPAANEIGGIVLVDETATETSTGDVFQYDGSGFFVPSP